MVSFWGEDKSQSIIIGAPEDFNLSESLNSANRIRIAVAFMNSVGLKKILSAISKPGQVSLQVLVGLNFGLTEPNALKKLLTVRKQFNQVDIRVILPQTGGVFHPKVLAVYGKDFSFALVGSANCTMGGYQKNCECTSYIEKENMELIDSFFEQFKDNNKHYVSRPLTFKLIVKYIPRWEKMRQSIKSISKISKKADTILIKEIKAEISEWDNIVNLAKAYSKKEWKQNRLGYQKAVIKIKKSLNYPYFTNITFEQWQKFYDEWHLGHLIQIYRDRIFKHIKILSNGLRYLIKDVEDLPNRVDNLLKIYGVGPNLATKILTCHDPESYPTWNDPIIKSLSYFGLELPRGATGGEKYAAFRKIMNDLKSQAGLENMLEADAVLYRYWELYLKDKKG